MGENGCGTASKMINQQLVGAHAVAACEAWVLGKSKGVDGDALNKLMDKSWGQSKIQQRVFSVIIEDGEGLRNSKAPLRNLAKDVDIAVSSAKHLGLNLPVLQETSNVIGKAMGQGRDGQDMAVMHEVLVPPTSRKPSERSILD